MKKYCLILLAFLLYACGEKSQDRVGETLSAWTEGTLDIHFINTARGECTFQIFPDGTTFLVDASGTLLKFGERASDPFPPKPSSDITAGQVIVDYVNHFSPSVSKGHVNYFMLTHFDGDHMGQYKDELPLHESGEFRLSSLPEIGTSLVLDKIMDRCYPDYSYPTLERMSTKQIENYRAFLSWTQTHNSSEVERWDVGSDGQVVPVYEPNCGVSVRNISGNGRFWTGEGSESWSLMPEDFSELPAEAIPAENVFSCGYILSFGNFDFFLGGDLQYNDCENYPYKDAESPVVPVAHKVEVMKANHHGTNNTNSRALLDVLKPDVWVVTNWRDVQPRPATVDRVLEANPDCDIYSTNMAEVNIPILGDRLEYFKDTYGSVVVRVAADGNSYMVYVLDDTDSSYRIKTINGPYRCVN